MHDSAYTRKKGKGVDISRLRHVLRVDEEECVVDAEPLVSMEQLVAATLRHGLIPKVGALSKCFLLFFCHLLECGLSDRRRRRRQVVPEFKTITVGEVTQPVRSSAPDGAGACYRALIALLPVVSCCYGRGADDANAAVPGVMAAAATALQRCCCLCCVVAAATTRAIAVLHCCSRCSAALLLLCSCVAAFLLSWSASCLPPA